MTPARRLTRRLGLLLPVAAVLALVVAANLWALRAAVRFDLTSGDVYTISPQTRRVLERVFSEYTSDPEELKFDRTRGVVRLFEHGTRFVSRSEAKRLASGLQRFREVLVDFEGVEGVGQGFVDQLFRVWASAHPETKLIPVNMNRAVELMVRRGLPRE